MTLLAKAIYLLINAIQNGGMSSEDTTEVHPENCTTKLYMGN